MPYLCGLWRFANAYCKRTEKEKFADSSSYLSDREYILIDFSSRHKDAIAPMIEIIQSAIEERKILSFHYYAQNGDSIEEIEAMAHLYEEAHERIVFLRLSDFVVCFITPFLVVALYTKKLYNIINY